MGKELVSTFFRTEAPCVADSPYQAPLQFEPKMPIQLSELRRRTDLDLPSGSYFNRSERKQIQTQRLLKWLIKIHGISDLDHSWPSKTH